MRKYLEVAITVLLGSIFVGLGLKHMFVEGLLSLEFALGQPTKFERGLLEFSGGSFLLFVGFILAVFIDPTKKKIRNKVKKEDIGSQPEPVIGNV